MEGFIKLSEKESLTILENNTQIHGLYYTGMNAYVPEDTPIGNIFKNDKNEKIVSSTRTKSNTDQFLESFVIVTKNDIM